jgi:hypothetical protein
MLVVLSSGMGGCATHGAPTFVLFGAYFPAWMLVGLIGILAGVAARVVMVTTGLAEVIPSQLLSCVSIGATIAILAWLIGFAG